MTRGQEDVKTDPVGPRIDWNPLFIHFSASNINRDPLWIPESAHVLLHEMLRTLTATTIVTRLSLESRIMIGTRAVFISRFE